MLSRKALVICAVGALMATVVAGCGETQTDLGFARSDTTPVVIYTSYKAIAPVYNPDVPVVVIYGNGTVVKKDGPYTFRTGSMTGDQLTALLKKLDSAGFFAMNKQYRSGQALAGGTTDMLKVNLESGAHAVSVEGGAGPPGWGDIVAAVTNAKVSKSKEYVPLSITVFAREVGEVPPGANSIAWPGSPADLASAAAAPKGYKLEGAEAANAWKAITGAYNPQNSGTKVPTGQSPAGEETYWSAGGKVYTYVYARPILPGGN